MSKNQKGFSVVECILILIIVGIVGFVGWYVWQSRSKTNSIYSKVASTSSSQVNSQPKQSYTLDNITTNSKSNATIEYPVDWVATKSWNLILKPKNSTDTTLELNIAVYSTKQTAKEYFDMNNAQLDTPQQKKSTVLQSSTQSINNYDTYTAQIQASNETYWETDVSHNSVVVHFVYSDIGKKSNELTGIVNSLKFK